MNYLNRLTLNATRESNTNILHAQKEGILSFIQVILWVLKLTRLHIIQTDCFSYGEPKKEECVGFVR